MVGRECDVSIIGGGSIAADVSDRFVDGGLRVVSLEAERVGGAAPAASRERRLRRSAGCLLALVACLVAGCALPRGPEPTRTSALRAPQLMVPVEGVSPDQVPDTFRALRGRTRIHGAVDIPAPRGTPVLSADDGYVLRLHRNRKGGLTIYATDTSERYVYYYAHLDRYRSRLAAGDRLVRGQVIGFVGTTGDARGGAPHLHFQLMERSKDGQAWGGKALDPRPFFTTTGRTVPLGKRRA